MAINTPDLISLPVPPDLVSAGIQYACRAQLTRSQPVETTRAPLLRQAAAQAAVELALAHHLSFQDIPYTTLADEPFTDPQHARLVLGGHRCEVQARLVTDPPEIERFHHFPQRYLDTGRVDFPVESLPGTWEADDLLVAGILTARLLHSQAETRAAWLAIQPIHLVYPLPAEWISPRRWSDPGPLSLQSGCSQPVTVELEGLDGEHHLHHETIDLDPGECLKSAGRFFALATLRILQAPDGPLALGCGSGPTAHRPPVTIQPRQWANLWLYSAGIILLGYQRRIELHSGESHRGLPLSELLPLAGLFKRLKEWEKR